MRESSRGWMEKVTRRIGMGGVIEFSTTAVGQTLHVPCRAGDHLVDFPIPAHCPPDVVVKKMLAAGWTVGNHSKCPDCSRSRQSKANSEIGQCGDNHGGRCTARNGEAHPHTGSIVVLTLAHEHGVPLEEESIERMFHACQRCHNRYDAPMRRAGIKARARAVAAIGDMFDDSSL